MCEGVCGGRDVCVGRIYMYGGRNDEDGSFADVDCYDIGEGVCVGGVCVGGGMCVCGRDVHPTL